LWFRWTRLPSL